MNLPLRIKISLFLQNWQKCRFFFINSSYSSLAPVPIGTLINEKVIDLYDMSVKGNKSDISGGAVLSDNIILALY